MEQKQFVSLVERLESYAREHPTAYKLRVGALAALGYCVLLGTVGLVLLLVGGSMYLGVTGMLNIAVIKFMVLPIGVGAVVLRSLWVEFPKPQGHPIRAADAPRLFEVIERIRKATKGPKVHQVLLNEAFNAYIVQRPRLGILGWQENYLILGLPMMNALSPDEMRAIIAHEFGHLSGQHGAFSGWIYRVRQTWIQVLQNMRKHRHYGSRIFERVFAWYAPYFSAYSFVLNRATEFEADHQSVVLAGRQNAACALVNTELKQRVLDEEHWPEFYRGADTQPEPPEKVFSTMLAALRRPLTQEKAQTWFEQMLRKKHSYDDTHPALGDRLEAIGYPNVREIAQLETFTKNGSQRADEYFFQSAPVQFIAQTDSSWGNSIGNIWRERYKFVVQSGKTLAKLEEKSKTEELTIEERWERAQLISDTQGKAAAVPFLEDVIALQPDHASANYILGEVLLAKGDEAGVEKIELVMGKDPHATPAGCELIFNYLAGVNRMQDAEMYKHRVTEYQQKVELGRSERTTIKDTDSFKSHGVAPDALVALRAQLAKYSEVASAHLVQKAVKHFPEDQSYVLGIRRKRAWYQSQDNKLDQALIDRLASEVSFPGYTYIIALEHNYKSLRRIFSDIRGSEIYRAV